jgi:hypothetical protein
MLLKLCDKMPVKKQLKGGNIYFGSWFQTFRQWFANSIALGLRQNIMAPRANGRRECTFHGSQEATR